MTTQHYPARTHLVSQDRELGRPGYLVFSSSTPTRDADVSNAFRIVGVVHYSKRAESQVRLAREC